ncbi:MAG: hydroxyacid dehydrogenase [Candidatus Promineifilaceae bacterium]
MFRIMVADKLAKDGLDLLEQADDVEFELRTKLTKQELLSAIQGQDALIIRSGTVVDRDVIESGIKLRVVGRAGIGVDNIDIEAATEHGVLVMNSPEASTIATAEHTMALLLAASRQLVPAHVSLRDGEWRRAAFQGIQLHGKRLGIIGLGRIGRHVAERASGFGMLVAAYDPYVSRNVFDELAVEPLELSELLARSDFISIHTIKTPETSNIIDRQAISKMKQGVVLVNAARGGLVDEVALSEALASGKVRAAAIDVFSSEPPQNNPLIGLPNVLHTPHLGASTVEAQRDVAIQIVDQVIDALRGVDYRNVINVDVLHDYDSMRSGF